jgi:hypothetical protein
VTGRRFLIVSALLLTAAPVAAHHSFSSEFDDSKPVKLTGTVTKVEWLNPHVWFFVNVANPDGSITNWAFSAGAPGQLMRRGINKQQLPVGATVTVEGFRAKDGSYNASSGRVTFPDGRNVFTAGQPER